MMMISIRNEGEKIKVQNRIFQKKCYGSDKIVKHSLINFEYQISFELQVLNNFKQSQKGRMKNLVENTTIKLGIEHNISSSKVLQARFDLNQTILAVKQNVEARYGSIVPYMKLQLKDAKNNLIAEMDQDNMTLGQYGAQTGMCIYVIDLNPNSILKEIESYEGVEKYMISDEDYDKLPQNFRKWKKQFLKDNPHIIHMNKAALPTEDLDPEYLSELASTIQVGSRCKLESGARGEVGYVGKIMDLGNGYFVGVKLDEPFGNSNGIVNGVKYFESSNKYATFVRPNTLEIGDFPVLDIDDEI